jgi:hypothetical protein
LLSTHPAGVEERQELLRLLRRVHEPVRPRSPPCKADSFVNERTTA